MSEDFMTICMCGDVMTGRGIDQIFPHPCNPRIFEPYVGDARRYVELAEAANGAIPKPVGFSYIWGHALDILDEMAPQVRLINLETSITTSDDYWKGKWINYRMNPQNTPCLTAARIDVCSLANNHVLDWGYDGLAETLRSLEQAGIQTAGAGLTLNQANAPAVVDVSGRGRVLVFGFGSVTSGIPGEWGASPGAPGVNLLPDMSDGTVQNIASRIAEVKRHADVVVVSVHWGENWGYEIPSEERIFAHELIDRAGVDIIHGHSSHHAKGIEVYCGKLVIYGCGDFINDYEGISGYERYRGDLGLMYFAEVSRSGQLAGLRMKPTRMKNFRLNPASPVEAAWLRDTFNSEGKRLGTRVESAADGSLILRWH